MKAWAEISGSYGLVPLPLEPLPVKSNSVPRRCASVRLPGIKWFSKNCPGFDGRILTKAFIGLRRTMEISPTHLSWKLATHNSPLRRGALVFFVAVLGYLAATLGGVLILRPQMVWPLWPGNAILASLLLLVPRRRWPILLAAGLAGFVLYDLQAGVTIRSTAWLILADTVEILTAAVGVKYAFDGVPRLNSVRALAKYSVFAVILAPLSVTFFVGAIALLPNYWTSWRISFFSEALAFLTVTPAILGLASQRKASFQASRAHYLEAATLIAALVSVSYFLFLAPGRSAPPALLYSLVPFLIWSALRFGAAGVGTSGIIVALMSIWGAVHGRGPFTEGDPISRVLFLQLFLLFTSLPFMVLAVLVEERERVEGELREGEERFRLMADTAPALVWMSGTDKLCTFFNKGWLDFTGRSMEQELGEGWSSGVHPDDLERCLGTYSLAFDARKNFNMEYRLRRSDGQYYWIADYGVPRFGSDGTFLGYIGSCIDITDLKLSEEALRDMGGRLILAHEQERARIARELHDDLSQRMALVQIGLEQLSTDSPELSSQAQARLTDIAQTAEEISSELHHLSHQLHPSKLDTLGLIAAVSGYCREFQEQHALRTQFVHRNVPRQLSKDVTLCVYRIVQESLRNVVKHSSAQEAEVELTGDSGQIDLRISDSGAGFDLEAARARTGLGLISMRERLRLLGGQLCIESHAGRGTKIHVRIPFLQPSRQGPMEHESVDRAQERYAALNGEHHESSARDIG